MTVVRNEFERGENSPQRILSQRMMAAAYEWHNYGKSTIGNRTDIERVPIENLQAFYQQVLPARQRRADRRRQVRRDEGPGADRASTSARSRSRTRKLDNTYTEEPPQDGERTVDAAPRRHGRRWSARSTTSPPASHADFPALRGARRQCSTVEPVGRLYKALVETKKATSVQRRRLCAGTIPGVHRDHRPQVRQEQARTRSATPCSTSLEKLGKTPVTEEEVERAKPQLAKEPRAADDQQQPHRRPAERVGGPRRLAAVLPAPRPRRQGDAGRRERASPRSTCSGSNRTVGVYIPTEKPRAGRRSRPRPTWPSWSRTTRAARRCRAGRGLRPDAGEHREARAR